jgi:hypothetical protein
MGASAAAAGCGMIEPRVIGEFDAYPGLVAALRARVAELDVSGECLDELAGLPRGYFQKLLGTRPVKRIGLRSLADVFGALAVKAVLVEDQAALARISSRLVRRKNAVPAAGTHSVHFEVSKRFLRKIAAMGGKARAARLTPRQRSMLARKMALARWRKRAAAPRVAV